jgi:hypothetical protein
MNRVWLGAIAAFLLAGCGADGSSGSPPTSQNVVTPPTIRFAGDWSVQVNGPLIAGEPIVIDYDVARLPTCRGDMYGKPAWSISGSWRSNGGEVTTFPLAGHSPTGSAIVPVITPPASGALELWFFNGNMWGCNAWDSSFGKNYHFTLDAPDDAPGWMGNAAGVISRWTCSGGPCESDRQPLEQGFSFDTWARQRAAIAHLYLDVWRAGVTDWDNPELWQQLDVRMYYRFGASGPFLQRWVNFDRRVGNDARYAVPLRQIDPLPGNTITDPGACPQAPLAISADGNYVRTSVELYFVVNGVELRPSSAAHYQGAFEDHVGLYAPCLP